MVKRSGYQPLNGSGGGRRFLFLGCAGSRPAAWMVALLLASVHGFSLVGESNGNTVWNARWPVMAASKVLFLGLS